MRLHLLLESHDHVEAVTVEHLEDEHVCATVCLTESDSATKDTLVIQVSLIDQVLYFSPLIFWIHASGGLVHLSEHVDGLGWLLINLEEEQLEVGSILESSDQIKVFLSVPLLQHSVEFDVIRVSFEVGAQWNRLRDKLLG